MSEAEMAQALRAMQRKWLGSEQVDLLRENIENHNNFNPLTQDPAPGYEAQILAAFCKARARPVSEMTARELAALAEIAAWQTRHRRAWAVSPYYWRKASMQKLAARGLVEPYPGHGTGAQPAWRITAAGREALA